MDVREKLVELLAEFYGCDPMYYGVDALAIAQHLTANGVAPVVHGRWEKWNGDDRHHCTVCECYANAERDSYGYIAYEFLDNYCPNCGAQMHEDDFCSYGERKEDKAE